jgi:hypothetical protein
MTCSSSCRPANSGGPCCSSTAGPAWPAENYHRSSFGGSPCCRLVGPCSSRSEFIPLAQSLPWPFLAGAILGTRGINAVPSLARYWVFLLLHVLPVHLSRRLFSDSAGGETFTGRLSPFAGGSRWQRLIALPIAHADAKHRERSAAKATYGRLATSIVAALAWDNSPAGQSAVS